MVFTMYFLSSDSTSVPVSSNPELVVGSVVVLVVVIILVLAVAVIVFIFVIKCTRRHHKISSITKSEAMSILDVDLNLLSLFHLCMLCVNMWIV